jgi:crotonobetainyl-CoA:carnitine CoA-transferase CaiB-like acyl-CoA transferase/acyl-CoA synthetase (AMP-forming)/AMP-acid ligase II
MNLQALETLPQLLSAWAASQPSAPAIVSVQGSLTYRDLDEQVHAFAVGLRQLGVGPGSVVGLMCTNRPEWVVAALATVQLGGRVAAFNTWARKWDLQHLLQESGCDVLVALSRFRDARTESLLRELLPEAWEAAQPGWHVEQYPRLREIVLVDPQEPAPGVRTFADVAAARPSDGAANDVPVGNEPIFVLYTSGSTARPKAVPIHHRTALEHGRDVAERMSVTSGDKIWIPVPLFWSYGGANALMVSLTTGATVVLQEAFEAAEGLRLIEQHRCTVAYTLPNITNALVTHPDFDPARVQTLTKGMTIGSAKDVETAGSVLGITGICNAYGSTELYGGCCVTPSQWPLERKMATQGPPLPGNTVVIRHPLSREPVPAGEVGEITVRGQVTSGYLDDPDQTGAAFSADGEFRTGDLGSLDAAGDLHFVGRASEMIRTGGINIAPAEVEEFLRTHPSVGEVAVVGVPDEVKGEVAVAFVTVAQGAEPLDETELKAYCRDQIASYKIPARMVITPDSLPPPTPASCLAAWCAASRRTSWPGCDPTRTPVADHMPAPHPRTGVHTSMGPLAGVKIIELAGVGPAPFCAMLLSDLGADVISVQRPSAVGRPLTDPVAMMTQGTLARGRRSVAIDLKDPDGVATMHDMVGWADALIEGFRPGVMERLGLGPEECLQRNPALVYGRMTGWGQDGPYAQAAGHDINYIALAGALAHMGRRDERPVPPLNLVGDFGGGGLLLGLGIVAALFETLRSGRGQVIDAAMVDGSALQMTMMYELLGRGQWDERREANMNDGGAHFYEVYETADDKYVSIAAMEPKFFNELLHRIGIDSAELPEQWDRSQWPAAKKRLAEVFRTRTRQQWCDLLEGTDACFAPVLTMSEALHHPHNVQRGTFTEVGGIVQPAPAPRFSRTPAQVQRPAAEPGEHTDEVLSEVGLDADRIALLRERGVVA